MLDRQLAARWLKDRPVDDKGRAVPYINMWGDPTDDLSFYYLKEDPLVDDRMALWCRDRGDVPNFTRQSWQRARRCVVEGLCQVCARFIPWSDRLLILADVAWRTVEVQGRIIPAAQEPWICATCVSLAVNWCPELIRRRRDQELALLHITSPDQVLLATQVGSVEGPLEEYTKQNPVVMGVDIGIVDPRLQPQFVRTTGRSVPG